MAGMVAWIYFHTLVTTWPPGGINPLPIISIVQWGRVDQASLLVCMQHRTTAITPRCTGNVYGARPGVQGIILNKPPHKKQHIFMLSTSIY